MSNTELARVGPFRVTHEQYAKDRQTFLDVIIGPSVVRIAATPKGKRVVVQIWNAHEARNESINVVDYGPPGEWHSAFEVTS